MCPACRAPAVIPFPQDWCVDVIRRGSQSGPVRTTLMPHRPRCMMRPMVFAGLDEGMSVRVPGDAVIQFGLSFGRGEPN